MIQITPQMRIWLAAEPVDFRNNSERLIIPSRGPKVLKRGHHRLEFELCASFGGAGRFASVVAVGQLMEHGLRAWPCQCAHGPQST